MPQPHESDILMVANPHVGCNDIDTEYGYRHSDYFQVNWDGKPHRIIPGKTKRMPRYLAEHFAKHLADHILLRMEETTKKKGLMTSPIERPKVINTIILGVDEWHLAEEIKSVGERVVEVVSNLNKDYTEEEVKDDLSKAPAKISEVVNNLAENKAEVKVESKEETKKTSIVDPKKPLPTRKELLEECMKLDIELTGKETVEELVEKIKKF